MWTGAPGNRPVRRRFAFESEPIRRGDLERIPPDRESSRGRWNVMTSWLARRNWSQRIGAVFGAVYVLVGAAGFAVTSGVGFVALRGKDLVLFEVNPLHNVVHLGIGVALLYAALNSAAASRLMNRLIGGTYFIAAIVGTLVVQADTSLFGGLSEQRSELNLLALNHPDNVLHIASAIVLIGSTFIGRHRTAYSSVVSAQARDTSETGEMPAATPDELPAAGPARAVTVRRGRFVAGDLVPQSGSYRCACGQFAVAIRQGREFPDCPEPTGTDEDHYFRLQRKSTSAGRKSASAAKSASAQRRTAMKAGSRS